MVSLAKVLVEGKQSTLCQASFDVVSSPFSSRGLTMSITDMIVKIREAQSEYCHGCEVLAISTLQQGPSEPTQTRDREG